MQVEHLDLRRLHCLLLATALAAAGGALFAWLGLPAPWLAGSMAAVAAATFAGLPTGLPAPLRNAAFVLLGMSMGSSLTPDTLALMRAWPLSLVILALSVLATMLVAAAYLERVHGWDRVTARFSAMPGAFTVTVILAAESSADLPRVVLAQSVRLVALVALMPSLLTLLSPTVPGQALVAAPTAGSTDLMVMLTASAVAAVLLDRLRFPGGMLLGAMLASALLHGTDLVEGRPPVPLQTLGFVATGIVIGTRFHGASLAVIRSTVPGAVGSVLLALVTSAAFASLAALLLGLPFGQLWLAYAPGGVEAMAVMALALRLDPAFVGAHHVIRLIGLNLLSPRWARGRAKPG